MANERSAHAVRLGRARPFLSTAASPAPCCWVKCKLRCYARQLDADSYENAVVEDGKVCMSYVARRGHSAWFKQDARKGQTEETLIAEGFVPVSTPIRWAWRWHKPGTEPSDDDGFWT